MSLKAFHVVFVLMATLLAVGFGLWALREYLEHGTGVMLSTFFGSVAFAIGMVIYGVWFLRKLKHVSFL